ncbi:hypothetical protein [Thalassobacterium sedimentorum]|nr:hypothetical protein [Coraliomargarita sp. SDUM461004]
MKSRSALLIGGMFVSALNLAQAQNSFSDDFNRPDSSGLGSDYTYYDDESTGSSIFSISSQTAITNDTVNVGVAAINSGDFLLQTGVGFTVEVDILASATASSARVGLAYNFQDIDNYSLVRYRSSDGAVQVLSYTAGSLSHYNQVVDANYILNGTVNMLLSVDETGDYTVTLSATGLDDFVVTGNNNTAFSGGLAGLYYNGVGTGASEYGFDNLSASNIPESNSAALLMGIGAALFLGSRRSRQR